MKKVIEHKSASLKTEADFAGSRAGCVCSGSVAVANSHNKGPAYCVGYCGSHGVVTRDANMNVAKYN